MKTIVWLLFIGLFSISAACGDDNNDASVRIRIRNNSDFDFANVIVNSNGSGDVDFGVVRSNKTSEYRSFKFAYRYAYIKLSIDGKEYKLIPYDYVGEEQLASGKYTYELATVQDGSDKQLSLNFIED